MNKEKLLKIIENFNEKKILVVGDIILDKSIWGEVSRISPEAPVQVVDVSKESYSPGAAANVANNISALNAEAFMVGIIGNDAAKNILIPKLKNSSIDVDGIFIDTNKPTIQKVRVIGRSQQLLRFDYEKKGYIDDSTENKIFEFILKKINEIDAVIVSDYAKGIITKKLMEKLIGLCNKNNKIIVIDPKPKHKSFYKNSTLITPNHTEAQKMTGNEEEENIDKYVEVMGKKLQQELNSNVLITRGEKGMSLFEKNNEITHIPTYAKEVFDIVGAGDTSVATLTLALVAGATYKEAAVIANHAAGITVGKVGTSIVSIDELKKSIENE
ncbi:MAG: D-glycero-beta-D-manno-heptose-7-phosphate kinase [Candidatus Woesearchaeota archaeon]|jgi:rfaE bifunctional protein kinase chain/domain|nr:D-glycero-beta-D-manno-heptose-7-phosphate kinase [Candidatus Woesearchaeota archaeon]MDP7622722.1 D-glycero-beta-D-manno-heptose-7-phosphate kinase [Candidatus Woesearchaeota archaeon]HJN57063.1 D-glycero-beta-D-manno-heptose-7-phosphate kinase [Candidatus Woesearchaeota archaeon]|tara:strand:- start:2470 stop:3453 length:984 start_codon:yes stop_codon:yes gene_type:complete